MKADITRSTFDPSQHFLRVLMQQGRVQLDADWNEQIAILLHYMQALARDLIGPYGGPTGNLGFEIGLLRKNSRIEDLTIGLGRYYVDGILCENEARATTQYTTRDKADAYKTAGRSKQVEATPTPTYYTQNHYILDKENDTSLAEVPLLVYLDVWERHITWLEVPSIREVALGGPDTATRSQIVWQVKVFHLKQDEIKKESTAMQTPKEEDKTPAKAQSAQSALQAPDAAETDVYTVDWEYLEKSRLGRGRSVGLRARARPAQVSTDPCAISPDSRYRGAENQLYRVEIHRGNADPQARNGNSPGPATFKWSRENGSVVFPIRTINGQVATLRRIGRDDRLDLKVGDWVEIVDDDLVLRNQPGPLVQVDSVDRIDGVVTLRVEEGMEIPTYEEGSRKHPLLRRWDQKQGDPAHGGTDLDAGAAIVREPAGEHHHWTELEDGVEIQFVPGGLYRTGDYWLIPARVDTGDVEWPREGDHGEPLSKPPDGVTHHYAPLAIITGTTGNFKTQDLRCEITTLVEPVPPKSTGT